MEQENKSYGNADYKTRRFTTEFNTGEDTLKQMATIEWFIDGKFVEITEAKSRQGFSKNGDPFHILVDELMQLIRIYRRRVRNCMWSDLQTKEKEQYWNEIKRKYNSWKNAKKSKYFPNELMDLLEDYIEWLGEMKQQKIKLGIPIKPEYTKEEKLKNI